jgi:hypothetical protein
MDMALRDAEFNNIVLSRKEMASAKEIASALTTATTRDVSILSGSGVGAHRRNRPRKAFSGRPGWKVSA